MRIFSRHFITLKDSRRGRRYRRAVYHFPLENPMPTFVIERTIAGIGAASAADLQAISQKSCDVLRAMGEDVQWLQSFVTGNKVYCVYNAATEELVREHARQGGFPVDSVAQVAATISPETAHA